MIVWGGRVDEDIFVYSFHKNGQEREADERSICPTNRKSRCRKSRGGDRRVIGTDHIIGPSFELRKNPKHRSEMSYFQISMTLCDDWKFGGWVRGGSDVLDRIRYRIILNPDNPRCILRQKEK